MLLIIILHFIGKLPNVFYTFLDYGIKIIVIVLIAFFIVFMVSVVFFSSKDNGTGPTIDRSGCAPDQMTSECRPDNDLGI